MKYLFQNYKRGWVFIYFPFYLFAFSYLEKHTVRFHIIHTTLDKYIPFCEFFIVPYLLWFFFIASTFVYFFLKADDRDFYHLVTILYAGMTIFLIVSALFPNGHFLRPKFFARDNIFVTMVKELYSLDTSTNVLPSIHVFNTISSWVAISRERHLAKKKGILCFVSFLSVSIVLSTVLLKQHSIMDVFTALLLFLILYPVIYYPEKMTLSYFHRARSFMKRKAER